MDTNPTNSSERKPVETMTDRELLEETAHNMRAIIDVLTALSQHPMARMAGLGV